MADAQFAFMPDYLAISGEYSTISNGFATKLHSEMQLKYADVLAVDLKHYRSKSLLYATLGIGGIMALSTSYFGGLLIALFVVPTCAFGIAYFLSARQYIEITSMRGTYRIAVQRGDERTLEAVRHLQERMINAR